LIQESFEHLSQNVIKIDHYNFELTYTATVSKLVHFLRHSVVYTLYGIPKKIGWE